MNQRAYELLEQEYPLLLIWASCPFLRKSNSRALICFLDSTAKSFAIRFYQQAWHFLSRRAARPLRVSVHVTSVFLAVELLTNHNLVGDPDEKTTQHYEKMVKPAILAAFQKNPGLPWVSFTLVLRNGIPVVHVASTNKSYDGWIEFRKTVAEMSEGFSQALMVEVVEEKLEELGQPFPWRPFALGRSIGVERLEGSGTMGGYVTLTDKDGVKVG